MPELPEVETFVRSLRCGGMTGEPIVNRRIQSADLLWPRTLATNQSGEELDQELRGARIESVTRRGKSLRVDTEGPAILIHLRMSGDLRCEADEPETIQKHDRFVFHFADGRRLVFNDVRKFGRIWVTDEPQMVLGGLGVEPLSAEFTPEWMIKALHGKKQMIKPLLLDQHFIAGIGNIYSDEALFQARIHPQRAAQSLSEAEAAELRGALRAVLQKGIEKNGASFDWAYKGGAFQNDFQVYQQTGHPCPRCGTPIVRILVGQRGTHFCPACQRLTDE